MSDSAQNPAAQPAAAVFKTSDILDYAIKNEASDIHMSEGEFIGFRIHGHIGKIEAAGRIPRDQMYRVGQDLFGNEAAFKEFVERRDADFAHIAADGTPFRCNGFFKLGKMAFVLRRISRESKKLEDLKMPEGVQKALGFKQGLFLVTGPTGSGKSTSMVALVDRINEMRGEHIITIEDPVEFIFTPKKSVFSQREVGRDTKGFGAALRAAMREDPDIVIIGEMRDQETVEAAVNLADTGHLVFSTLHTSSAAQTVTRLIQFFPPELQHQAKSRLADAMVGVLSQRLIPKIGGGRAAIHELMYMTPGIRNLIRTGDFVQINNSIRMGASEGMVSMRSTAQKLTDEGIVEASSWAGFFANDDE